MSTATPRHMLPATFPKDRLVVLIDTREQCPLDFGSVKTEVRSLATGDYSAAGLESIAAIERKSLNDLAQCVGRDRRRFERELDRLIAFPVRAVVVEASWADIEAHRYRSQVSPESVRGSITSWIARGVPVVLADTRKRAAYVVLSILLHAARQTYATLRDLTGGFEDEN